MKRRKKKQKREKYFLLPLLGGVSKCKNSPLTRIMDD
jgi:hypothetical protein